MWQKWVIAEVNSLAQTLLDTLTLIDIFRYAGSSVDDTVRQSTTWVRTEISQRPLHGLPLN